jgi:hypothetical protein
MVSLSWHCSTGQHQFCRKTRGQVFGFSELAESGFVLVASFVPANFEKPNT